MDGKGAQLLNELSTLIDPERFKKLHWEGLFSEYLEMVLANPKIACTAFRRVYDMIMSHGFEEYYDGKDKLIRYNFFYKPTFSNDAIYGIDLSLMNLVQIFRSAALRYGPEKRVLLLHGPVGCCKSTIVRLIKRGLEAHSRTDNGAIYSFGWLIEPVDGTEKIVKWCPMNEEPLHLIPLELRGKWLRNINENLKVSEAEQIYIEGDLCPSCRYIYKDKMREYKGDWEKVLEHISVRRILLSEKDRLGIGTFQPKDEKNQDSTELTGDINYRKIAEYGSDSDPRAFNFDGEFNIANRGLVEFIEVLKLDVAFLYDLLGASQEHSIKPKKFPQTDIDEVIIGHTNAPEYKKLQENEYMEALRDRTVKVDIPYVTRLDDEIKIYKKDYNPEKIKGKHIAPHTLEIASMWAGLTRLEDPKNANLTIMQKLMLYNGKTLPGFTADNIKELHKEAKNEGMFGISPRYIQDKISNALVNDMAETCVNPFTVMNELEEGLKHASLITDENKKKRFLELLAMTKQEYEEICKFEVQRAICVDEEAIKRLCGNYIDNVNAFTQGEKVKNKYTGRDEEPDERQMRSIEEKIDIPDNRKEDFRREIMNYIGALAIGGKTFDYKSNERLHRALEMKMFEDQKDSIKLSSLVSSVIDKETQEKIDVVKQRMIEIYGYCDVCATDVLNFVASIFARGDVKHEKK